MHCSYYAEQAPLLVNYDYELGNKIDDLNQLAIHAHNDLVDSGTLPVRRDNDGNVVEYPRAPSWHQPCRNMDEETNEILSMLPGISSWTSNRILPGLMSYNKDDLTVNVLITKSDWVRCKPVKMKIGKYLKRLKTFTDDEVNNMANTFKSYINAMETCTLEIATSMEDIVQVYTDGPNSCMSGGQHQFEGHIHPVSVYATDDIGVAYVTLEGNIVARVLVNLVNHTYTEMYGNYVLLRMLLEKDNWEPGDLHGCRILCIDNKNGPGYIMPYIDGCDGAVEISGGYFELGGGWDVETQNTHGITSSGTCCASCDCANDADEMLFSDVTDGWYCDSGCAEDDGLVFAIYDEYGSSNLIRDDDAVYCETDGNRYDVNYLCERGVVEVDGDYYLDSDDDIVWSEYQDEWLLASDAKWVESLDSHVDDDYEEEEEDEDTYNTA